MKNGFTVRESTTCVDLNNYNEEVGKQICLDKIKDEIYKLLGYELQSQKQIVNPTNKALDVDTHVLYVNHDGFLEIGVIDGVFCYPSALLTMRPLWKQNVDKVIYSERNKIDRIEDMQMNTVYVSFYDNGRPFFLQSKAHPWFDGKNRLFDSRIVWMLDGDRKTSCIIDDFDNGGASHKIKNGAYPIYTWTTHK